MHKKWFRYGLLSKFWKKKQINDSEEVNIRLGVINEFAKVATDTGEVVVEASTVAASNAFL